MTLLTFPTCGALLTCSTGSDFSTTRARSQSGASTTGLSLIVYSRPDTCLLGAATTKPLPRACPPRFQVCSFLSLPSHQLAHDKRSATTRAGYGCHRVRQVIVLHLQIVQRVFPVFAFTNIDIDHKYVSADCAGDDPDIAFAEAAIEPQLKCASVWAFVLKCFPAGRCRMLAG